MKVSFILPNLGSGGAERVVTILSGALRERGYAVDIVMLLTDLVQYQVPDGVELVSLQTGSMTKLDRLKVLRRYFKKQKAEHGRAVAVPFQDNCLQYALAAAVGLGIPVIACERNDPYQKGSRGLRRFRANLTFALADQCVFQTPEARAYYRMGVEKKSRVIVNPLILPRDLRWQGQQSRKIISVGRLEPQKNQKLLIDAFARLHREFAEYTLEIYGEGVLRQKLQAQIEELGLQDAVYLRGYASDIHEKLTKAALFVLSSDYEGMSNALIEALAIGVPVVTTDHPIGGARMLVEDGVSGLMTPVGDAQALYQAMKRLLSDSEFAGSLSCSSVRVRERLALDAVVRQWQDVLDA